MEQNYRPYYPFLVLQDEVLMWADKRGLLKPENRLTQYAKTVSEVGELGDALIKNQSAEIRDALGDIFVTLIILAHQCGENLEDCLDEAYHTIKNRTGRTENGTFIKD